MPVEKRKITDYITEIGRSAQTSHYLVNFDGLSENLMKYLNSKGVDKDFIHRKSGLRCSGASLPGSSLATASIEGNFQGVQEKMAHSRIYTQLDLEFYVDRDYKMIRFFDCWIDYIAGDASTEGTAITNIPSKKDLNYYYRVKFPEGDSGYKCNRTNIVKFESDSGSEMKYTFFGMFPVNMSSVPIQYGNSDVLRMNVTFSYERYYKEMTVNSEGNKVNAIESSNSTGTLDTDPNALNRPTSLEEINSSRNSDMFMRDGVPSKY